MIYATSTQFAGEITAFLRHTQLYMFPAFCLGTVKASPSLSVPLHPSVSPLHHLQSIIVYFY